MNVHCINRLTKQLGDSELLESSFRTAHAGQGKRGGEEAGYEGGVVTLIGLDFSFGSLGALTI